MAGLLDVLQSPQGIGLLLAGIGSAGSGNPAYLNNTIGMQGAFQDLAEKRSDLEDRQKRREAASKLPGLIAKIMPGADGETLGLLSEIAPDTAVHGLLGALLNPRETPADLKMMDQLGLPRTQEGYAQFMKLKNANSLNPLQQAQLANIPLENQLKVLQAQNQGADTADKQQTADRAKRADQAAFENADYGFQRTIDAATGLMNNPDLGLVVGPIASQTPNLTPKSKAVQAQLDNLKSQGVLMAMNAARQGSQSGATGFGALSEKELEVLQNATAALSQGQGVDDFKKALGTLATHANRLQNILRKGRGMDENPLQLPGMPDASGAASGADGAPGIAPAAAPSAPAARSYIGYAPNGKRVYVAGGKKYLED